MEEQNHCQCSVPAAVDELKISMSTTINSHHTHYEAYHIKSIIWNAGSRTKGLFQS